MKCHLGGYSNGYFNIVDNKDTTLTLFYKPTKNLKAAFVRVYYSWWQLTCETKWYEWPLLEKGNVCDNLKDGECPLECGKEFTYTLTICIPKGGPYNMKTNMKVEILGEKNNLLACVMYSILQWKTEKSIRY